MPGMGKSLPNWARIVPYNPAILTPEFLEEFLRDVAPNKAHAIRMPYCPACGVGSTSDLADSELCVQHTMFKDDEWAHSNKVMCDFFHRGIVQTSTESNAQFWADAARWEELTGGQAHSDSHIADAG